jgi:hypothetical protein
MLIRYQLHSVFRPLITLCLFFILGGQPEVARASDHGDTPLLKEILRPDARLTDMYAFLRGSNLVLILNSNPAIPPGAAEAVFPSDVTFEIMIDNDSEVAFDELDDLATFGGTIVNPNKINKDIVFRVTFDKEGVPKLNTSGIPRNLKDSIMLFTGLRDDPFIRGPRIGLNIAAIVLEIPLEYVLDEQNTLLIWATTKVNGVMGAIHELVGRALRSQFPENDQLNTLPPKKHFRQLGVTPDVMIFNTAIPAAFPNGLELTDDVVDLVGDPRPLANDDPFPSENDVPFLFVFPYLAPPQ